VEFAAAARPPESRAQDAARLAAQLLADRESVWNLLEWHKERGYAVAHALKPDGAVASDAAADSIKWLDWVRFDRDHPKAPHPEPAQALGPEETVAAPAAVESDCRARAKIDEQLYGMVLALDTFKTLVGRMQLTPGQLEDLKAAGGHVRESLLIWADRLRWAGRFRPSSVPTTPA
jgi:hypothetical protein